MSSSTFWGNYEITHLAKNLALTLDKHSIEIASFKTVIRHKKTPQRGVWIQHVKVASKLDAAHQTRTLFR
ncbi:hypothetical protein N473_24725 [Pseudoalteromonas luteoviolacea CPMOR-1]|uniref:Uncharacterized protein n=1 Tax=Pseudoalteromonas luteoviolacea CPMOR-1 TaxID=1365248 RepID=A0A167IX62_9GAMM|nr:hypothetical protein N473_24725 [Pseudoalteromonas luteoviolacea CPMOR-1]